MERYELVAIIAAILVNRDDFYEKDAIVEEANDLLNAASKLMREMGYTKEEGDK